MERPARLRSGKTRSARNDSHEFLREEEERLGVLGFSQLPVIFFGLPFVFFCPSSSGGQRVRGATHPQKR